MAFNNYQYYFISAELKQKFDVKLGELFDELNTHQSFNLNKIESLLITQDEIDSISNWDDCELICSDEKLQEIIYYICVNCIDCVDCINKIFKNL